MNLNFLVRLPELKIGCSGFVKRKKSSADAVYENTHHPYILITMRHLRRAHNDDQRIVSGVVDRHERGQASMSRKTCPDMSLPGVRGRPAEQ
jgi:hypothetical protein